MTDQNTDFTMPSSVADRKRIADAINEIVGQMQMIEDRRAYIKDVKDMLKENFNMPKSVASRIAKARFKDAFEDMTAEDQAFEITYEALFKSSSSTDDLNPSDGETND